jgi:hypothetical protein
MNEIDKCAVVWYPPKAVATQTTYADWAFSTDGYEHANIYVMATTSAASQTAAFTTLALTESDTVTVATSQTTIAAFQGGTATSATAGFVMPTGQENLLHEFQVDLRKRKRYIGVKAMTGTATATLTMIAVLSRGMQSAETTTTKLILNNVITAAADCAPTFVNG